MNKCLILLPHLCWCCHCFDLSVANLFPTVLVFEKHNAVLLSFVCSERNTWLGGLFYELADGDLNAWTSKSLGSVSLSLVQKISTKHLQSDEQSSYGLWEHKWSSHGVFEKGLHSFGLELASKQGHVSPA